MHHLLSSIALVAVLVCGIAAAGPASAAKVLFNGTYQALPGAQGPYPPYFTAAAPQAFTLPAGKPVWGSFFFSFTFTFPPPGSYPYLYAKRDTYVWGAGSFMKSQYIPNKSYTLMHQESHYPRATLQPAPGIIKMKIGPNGFGGPMPIKANDYYFGTAYSPNPAPRYSNLKFYGLRYHNPCGAGTLPFGPPDNCTIFPAGGPRTNTATGGYAGSIWDFQPSMGFFTGTLTTFDYQGNDSGQIRTAMGYDNRNSKGTSGRIQLVTPELVQSYLHVGGPPPQDGTGQAGIASLSFETEINHVLTVDFLPEPGRLLMLGAGLAVLLGLYRLRR